MTKFEAWFGEFALLSTISSLMGAINLLSENVNGEHSCFFVDVSWDTSSWCRRHEPQVTSLSLHLGILTTATQTDNAYDCVYVYSRTFFRIFTTVIVQNVQSRFAYLENHYKIVIRQICQRIGIYRITGNM